MGASQVEFLFIPRVYLVMFEMTIFILTYNSIKKTTQCQPILIILLIIQEQHDSSINLVIYILLNDTLGT